MTREPHLPEPDDDLEDQESRRQARTGLLVLLVAVALGCGFFGLVVWRVLLPTLRAVWDEVRPAVVERG